MINKFFPVVNIQIKKNDCFFKDTKLKGTPAYLKIEAAYERKTILIVDDETSIRGLFKTALTQKNYAVLTAESGEKALEIIDSETIPVMFLDLNLPGINGIELCKKILEKAN
ncbi:MAG: response regulator [Desulfobacteraceae bacterium]|nr:response regulator [Desulfobacteraceae bacterium]